MTRRRKKEKLEELQHLPNVFQSAEGLKGHWRKNIFHNDHPIILELGCGHGHYTVNMARQFPEKNFIGVDVKGPRLWRGAKTAEAEGLKNTAFIRTLIEFIPDFFDQGEVSEIWVTFPDPYPQPAKEQKRLVSRRFLDLYRQILAPGGLIHLKTDNDGLYEWAIDFFRSAADVEVLEATADLYQSGLVDPVTSIKTHYEEIFLKEGKHIKYVLIRLV